MPIPWKRLLPLLLALFAVPLAAWFAGRADAEYRRMQERLTAAGNAMPLLTGIRERVAGWPPLRAEIDHMLTLTERRGWRASHWGQRRLLVESRTMSRREADAYLRAVRGSEQSFFLVDSFALLAPNADYGLYAAYQDEAQAGGIVLTLKGGLYTRDGSMPRLPTQGVEP